MANASPDAFITIDSSGKIVSVNPAVVQMFGYEKNELIGRNVTALMPERYKLQHRQGMKKFFETGEGPLLNHTVELHGVQKGRNEFPIELSLSAWETDGEPFVTGIIRDISERKRVDALGNATGSINEAISMALGFGEVMKIAVKGACLAVNCESAIIMLRDNEHWTMRSIFGQLSSALAGKALTEDELSLVEIAYRTKKPVRSDDAYEDQRFDWSAVQRYRIRSFISVPLIAGKRVLGVLFLAHHSAPVSLSKPETDFVERLGASVSLAAQSAQSHEGIHKELYDARSMNRLSARLAQSIELDEVLDASLSEVLALLGISHGCIYVFNPAGQLVIRAQRQLSQAFLKAKTTISVNEGCAGRAATTKEAFIPGEEEPGTICHESEALLGLDCMAAIPIVKKEKILGIVELFGALGRRIPGDERELLGMIINQLATAVDNARLYSIERSISQTLQEALLTVPERIEGLDIGHVYRSATAEATMAGGDFYDFFEIGEDKVGMMIGDVSGMGLEAATLTALVKNTVKAFAYSGNPPTKIVEMTNDVLTKACPPFTIVTLFVAVLEKYSGSMTYVNAGHPPPILKTKKSEIRLLGMGAPAIGVFEGLKYSDAGETLGVGDTLLMYTDGVIEARRNGEIFGVDRLTDLMTGLTTSETKKIPLLIKNHVLDYGEHSLADDLAIVTVSRPVSRGYQVAGIAEKISAAGAEEEALDALADGLTRVIDVSGAMALLIDPERQRLHGKIGRPEAVWPEAEKIRISLDDTSSVAVASINENKVVVIDNVMQEPLGKKWLARFYHPKSVFSAPISTDREVFGAVVVIETRRFRHFTDEETETAASLAGEAGERIEYLRKESETA